MDDEVANVVWLASVCVAGAMQYRQCLLERQRDDFSYQRVISRPILSNPLLQPPARANEVMKRCRCPKTVAIKNCGPHREVRCAMDFDQRRCRRKAAPGLGSRTTQGGAKLPPHAGERPAQSQRRLLESMKKRRRRWKRTR